MKRINASDAKLMLMKTLFVCLPFLVVLIISCANGFSMFDLRPRWSDEFFWHSQVKGVLAYGKPLGYWGYNGTHAEVGTFAAWGAPIVIFMSFFAGLVPGNLNMLILSNLLCACLANYAFLMFTKPEKKTLLRLIIIYATLYVNHLYSLTAFAEIFRYSLAVLLAGLTYFLLRNKAHPRYSVVLLMVAPCVILVAMSAYIPFAAILPIWCYLVYKRYPVFSKYKWLYALASVGFTAMSTVIVYSFEVATEAPYVTDWFGEIRGHLSEGVGTGVQFLLVTFWKNIKKVVFGYAISSLYVEYGFLSYYVLAYFFAIAMAMWAVFRNLSNSLEKKEIPAICLYYLVAVVSAFALLYSDSYWNFIRGLNMALVYVLYLTAADSEVSSVNMGRKIALFSLVGVIPFICTLNATFLPGRASSFSEDETLLKEKFAEYIQLSEEGDPWGNTVSYYGYGENILYLPDGVGVNYMLDSSAEQNARYCVLEKGFASEDFISVLMEYDHCILYENDDMVLMINEAF